MKNLFFLAAFFTAAFVFGGNEKQKSDLIPHTSNIVVKVATSHSFDFFDQDKGYTCTRYAYDMHGNKHEGVGFSRESQDVACFRAWQDAVRKANARNREIMRDAGV